MRKGNNNLYLVAPMLSGKTKIGNLVGEKLSRPVIDLDAKIIELAGLSIPDIFALRGEEGFRVLESIALRALAQGSNLVISTGGGAVCRAKNRIIMRNTGTVVWLDVALPILLQRRERKSEKSGRPLADKLEKLFLQRRSLYEEVAHITVKVTVEAPAEEIAQRVLRALEEASE
ncbi:MAG: shikimate kinase [bacterium]|nr:shikimate kinase [bacterium]